MVELGSGSQRESILKESGVKPETLAPAEDVNKLERKLESDGKKILKDT